MDMVSECLRTGQQFGVCLISSGKEVGGSAECYEIGTLAKIIDWDKRDDGLLEIIVEGEQRFRLLNKRVSTSPTFFLRVITKPLKS